MTIPQQQGTVTDISLNNKPSNTTTTMNLTDEESSAAPATDPRHLLVAAYASRRRSRVHQLNVWLSQFKKVAGERDGLRLGSCQHAGLTSSAAIPPLPVLESHPDDVFFKSHKNLEELIDFTVLHEPFSDTNNQ